MIVNQRVRYHIWPLTSEMTLIFHKVVRPTIPIHKYQVSTLNEVGVQSLSMIEGKLQEDQIKVTQMYSFKLFIIKIQVTYFYLSWETVMYVFCKKNILNWRFNENIPLLWVFKIICIKLLSLVFCTSLRLNPKLKIPTLTIT